MEIPTFDLIYANLPQKLDNFRMSFNIQYLQKFSEQEINEMFKRIPFFEESEQWKDQISSQDSNEQTNDKTYSPKRKQQLHNHCKFSIYLKGLSHIKHWFHVMQNLMKLNIVQLNMDSHLGTQEELNSWFMTQFWEKESIKELTLRLGNPAMGNQRKMVGSYDKSL